MVMFIYNSIDRKIMKLFKRCSLLVLSLAFSVSIMSGNASAASDYDNLLRTSPILYVHTDGSTKSQKMDISDSWWPEFKQVYAKRILQGYAWPSNFATEFEDIVQNGGRWGVATYEDSTGALIEIYGTHDPDAYCGFVGSASTGQYQCTSNYGYGFVRASFFVHSSYANLGCTPVNSINSCSETGMNIYAAPEVISGTAGYTFLQMPNWALEDYPFFFMNFDLNYPVGYEGELIPQEAPDPKYVAMGDSFSSGEGNPPFEAGTNENGVNECHRSPKAYPRLLSDENEDLSPMTFVACSGATTANVLNGGSPPGESWSEPDAPQVNALTEDVDIVTITIGGNDVGFKEFATNCALASCSSISQAYENIMDEINNDFQNDLEDTYTTILEESGDADVFVVGYPYLTGDSWGSDCQTFEIVSDLGARAVTDAVNDKIESAVNVVKANVNHLDYDDRLVYVPANSSNNSSSFDGQFICSSPPYFNDMDTTNQEYSFHPNSAGHSAYSTIVELAIN